VVEEEVFLQVLHLQLLFQVSFHLLQVSFRLLQVSFHLLQVCHQVSHHQVSHHHVSHQAKTSGTIHLFLVCLYLHIQKETDKRIGLDPSQYKMLKMTVFGKQLV
jgi:hypothetical protein